MRYCPYEELGDTANIIVDGAAQGRSLITLSHWPHSGTPHALKDDLSAQIVFRYLDRPDFWVNAEAVSNNHFDEDGLVGVYTLLHPERAKNQRMKLTEIAAAGDFGTFRVREAARAAFVLSAFADPEVSPLEANIFQQPYPKRTSCLYLELMPRLPEIIDNLEGFRPYWEAEDALVDDTEAMIRGGTISIEEVPSLDLAIVTLPEDLSGKKVHRFTQERRAVCHPMALHNSIRSFRVLLMQGRTYEFQYRYESWVQYMSRRPLPRIDLAPLAERLSEAEGGSAQWVFDGVQEITPELALRGADESRISPDQFREEVTAFLATAEGSWNPYDPMPPGGIRDLE